MQYIVNCLIGILIGAAAILPGISSGVLCVVLGIYEKLIDSIINFTKNFKFLLSITIGVFFGIVLFGNILKFLFSTYYNQCCFIFIGLILGTVPALFKQANKNGFKCKYLLYAVITFIISIILFILKGNINNTIQLYTEFSNFEYIISGFIMSIGVVVPGVSNTAILMILGIYEVYLDAIATLNFSVLFPMGIGLFIGCCIFLKIIQILFKRAYTQTYYGIIGFTIRLYFANMPTGFYLI